MLINTGNISRKVLPKVLRSFDKNFERLQEACKYPHDVYYTSNSSYFYMPLGRIIEKEGLTTKVWNHLKKNGGYGDFISIIRAYDYINNKKMCKRLFTRFFQYCEFLVYDESYYEQNTE